MTKIKCIILLLYLLRRRFFMKRLMFTLIVMMSLLIASTGFSVDCKFNDIHDVAYAYAIQGLFEQGVVQNGYEFSPQEELTKDDAAAWLVKAFFLAEIEPMYVEEEVEKKFEYSNGLGVIDETFTVPSFKDTKENENERFIEGLSAARIVKPADAFSPDSGISGVDFATMIGKIVFGIDCEKPLEKL